MSHFPPHVICVNPLPCKTQMVQIVTLYGEWGDYQYQIDHLFIISSADGAR